MGNVGLIVVIAAAFIGVISGIMIFAANYIKAEPHEALVFTGRKHRGTKRGWVAVVGGAKFRIPVLEIVNKISLKTMNLPEVRVEAAYSAEGVPVTIEAVANVKISSEQEMLGKAVERFLGTTDQTIKQIIKETLEGQLRDIIGVMTVEQLYQERDMFVNKVLQQSGEELAKIGVIIDIINIQDIRDDRGYLEALGRKRTAEVIRDAEIGEAEAKRDAMKQSETARREGEVVRADQERQIAEAEKNRDVAQQHYVGQTLGATRKAEQQGPLFEAKARQEVVIEEQKVLEEQQKARERVESARAEAEEQKYRADRVIPAEADRQAVILKAEGEAAAILKRAEAQAKGIQLTLEAEAEGLRKKAEAWNSYGKAAQLNLALEAIKEVAGKGADALGEIKFDKVIAIDSGGEGDTAVNRMLTAVPAGLVKFMEQMKAATGMDLADILKKINSMEEEPAEATQITGDEAEAEVQADAKPKSDKGKKI
ncbi:MAG: flotillin family protein [Phycisphaerae bacterium]|nr:flotillin family protein [Phycisphaerae bacterium]